MAKMKINELPKSSVLRIREKDGDGGFRRTVKAPLPDGFGMSVGSAFTDPSSVDLADAAGGLGRIGQIVSAGARAASRASGVSTKIAQRSNVWYSGPEPSEISFEMIFNSYYSAWDEVLVPTIKLMMMSVGREKSFTEMNETFDEELQSAGSDAGFSSKEVSEAAGEFGFIQSAGICIVDFGTTFKIPKAYVSSTGVKFSNVLDNQGYPTSAEVSVTIKVVRNPTQNEIGGKYFSGAEGLLNDQ